jgi:hypothetical protein
MFQYKVYIATTVGYIDRICSEKQEDSELGRIHYNGFMSSYRLNLEFRVD